jgi:rRNA maturation RNase YbeY
MIQFIAEDVILPIFHINNTNRWIKKIAADYCKKVGKITFIFCSDKRILEINNQFLNHDYYTDIITFDYSNDNVISGDIFISVDTVKSNAEYFKVNFDAEIQRIIIHGILHLCGQEDHTPELRKEMTRKENLALQKTDIQTI